MIARASQGPQSPGNAQLMIRSAYLSALAGLLVAGSIVPADALTRLRADQTACAAIQATIEREGRVIVRYPSARVPNHILFNHYVAGDRFCRRGEIAVADTVPAADTPQCRVFVCEEDDPLFKFRFFID